MFYSWEDQILKTGIRLPSHQLSRGRIIGVIGESGSGKTTLFDHLFRDMRGKKLSTSYMKQDILLHSQLTVRETVEYYTRLNNGHIENIDLIMDRLGLTAIGDSRIGSVAKRGVSGGEKKRLIIAVHLLGISETVLLDEPLSGVDPVNSDLIMDALRGSRKTVIMSVHQFSGCLSDYFDEIWEVSKRDSTLYYRDTFLVSHPSGDMTDIILTDDPPCSSSSEVSGPYPRSSFFYRVLLLLRREGLISAREWRSICIQNLLPYLVVILQGVMIGFFRDHYKNWTETGDVLTLVAILIQINIILFTVAIFPISTLSDHINKYEIILHECRQDLITRGSYLSAAVFSDQISTALTGLIISMIQAYGTPIFAEFSGAVMMTMLFVNAMLWFCFFFLSSSYNVILRIMTGYLSISFLSGLGFLMRNSSLRFLKYLSVIHVQKEILLNTIQSNAPLGLEPQVKLIRGVLDPYPTPLHQPEWRALGIGSWIGLLALIALITFIRSKLN